MSNYFLKLEEENGLLYTHEICREETITVLVRDMGYSKTQAEEKVTRFLKRLNIEILSKDKSNKETVKWMFEQCKKAKIEFHPPDCFIIADFYKNRINKVYSGNNHFLNACRLFGMDAAKLRTPEKEIERQLKQIFKSRRK